MVTKVAREHAQGTVGTTRAAARPKGRFLRYFSRFFGAAPLENPPLCPPPPPAPRWKLGGGGRGGGPPLPPEGNENRRLYTGLSHFAPSTISHLHLFPGLRTPFSQNSSISRDFILSPFLAPTWIAPENSRSWRVLASANRGDWFVRNSKCFCRSFHLSRNDEIASEIIARDPF